MHTPGSILLRLYMDCLGKEKDGLMVASLLFSLSKKDLNNKVEVIAA